MSYTKIDNSINRCLRQPYSKIRVRNKYEKSWTFTQINTSSIGTQGRGMLLLGNNLYFATDLDLYKYESENLINSTGFYDTYIETPTCIMNIASVNHLLICSNTGIQYTYDRTDGSFAVVTTSSISGSAYAKDAIVFNSQYYFGITGSGGNASNGEHGKVYRYNNETEVYDLVGILTGSEYIYSLVAHDGDLYAGSGQNNVEAKGNIWKYVADHNWLDTDLSSSLSTNYDSVINMIGDRHRLYAFIINETPPINVYKYYNDAWSSFSLTSEDIGMSGYIYQNKLWIGSGGYNTKLKLLSEVVTDISFKIEANIQNSVGNYDGIKEILVYNDEFWILTYKANVWKGVLT